MSKTLFWDFDGTLAMSGKWSEALFTALLQLGYTIPFDDVRQHLSFGFTWHNPEICYTHQVGQKWWTNLFDHFDLLYEKYNILVVDRIKVNAILKSQIVDRRNYTLYDDTELTLRRCTEMGCRNFILSNNYPELPEVIKALGLSQFFVDYIVSANVGYEKPRVEIFNYALDVADSPDCCFMIGDNIIADIQGGNSAGMKTILVHKQKNHNANYCCDNLSEIPFLLNI